MHKMYVTKLTTARNGNGKIIGVRLFGPTRYYNDVELTTVFKKSEVQRELVDDGTSQPIECNYVIIDGERYDLLNGQAEIIQDLVRD